MLWWLADNANGVIVVLGLAFIVLTAVWWNSRRHRVGVAALVTLGLIAVLVVLSLVIVTDRKRLVASVQTMADKLNADKIDDALQHFADKVDVNLLGREKFSSPRAWLGVLARQKLNQIGLHRFVVSQIDVESLERPTAIVSFYVRPAEGRELFVCRAVYTLVGENDWRIKDLKVDLVGSGVTP